MTGASGGATSSDISSRSVPPTPRRSRPKVERLDPRRLVRELAIFRHVAQGLSTSPTATSVARAVIEALRTEAGVDRAAVYVTGSVALELVAHAGFDRPPAAVRPLPRPDDIANGEERLVRLATRRGLVGVLVLDAASGSRLSDQFLRSLAATLATALASASLLGRARREIRRARALRGVVKELTGTLDLGVVLGDIVDLTRTLFDADRAGLWLAREDEHPLEVAAEHGLSPEFIERVAALRSDDDAIVLRAMRDRRAFAFGIEAMGSAVGPLRDAYTADGIRTACIVPLVGGDAVLGVLGLYHLHERNWPEEEVALVEAFADQAAVAIQNARLYRSVADQAARMRSIQDLSARLNRLTDVRAIAEAIVAEAAPLADFHDIRVYRVDWDRRVCDPIAFTREMLDADMSEAEALLRVEIGEGFTGWVAENGAPLLINDALDDERGKTIDGTDDVPESMLVVPMLYEGRALGVIVLSQLGFNRFTNDDMQTMSIFAGYAAQAMANATTYGQLLAQSAELERRADSQRRLLEINERLIGTLDQAGVLETIADGLHDVVAYDNLSIYRADHEQRVLLPVLARERPRRRGEPLRHPVRPRAHGLGAGAHAADPRQRRPERPARAPDPRYARRSGGHRHRAAHRRRRGARRPQRLPGRRPGGVLQRQRLRARPALRGPGLDRPAQRRCPPCRQPARRHRRAHRPGQPRRLPARPCPARRGGRGLAAHRDARPSPC